MALVVNSNIPSLQAQHHLWSSQKALESSFRKLSSGARINTAADDAAGMGVSENLNAQIRSYAVAERNANNAISMVNTAEGGLGEVSGMLIRLRELAVQAANGDLSASNRGFLDTEFKGVLAEIDRVAKTTIFNGTPLLSEAATSIAFQVGVGTTGDDVISVGFGLMTATDLSISTQTLAGANGQAATTAITAIDAALELVSTRRAEYGGATNRLSVAVSNSQTMRSNLSAANSSIRDVDVAEETAQLARSQVKIQTGVAVLAQANQSPQLALQLLR